jgi:hypothetical protein
VVARFARLQFEQPADVHRLQLQFGESWGQLEHRGGIGFKTLEKPSLREKFFIKYLYGPMIAIPQRNE